MRSPNRFLLSSGLLATLALGACGGADTDEQFAMDTMMMDTGTAAAAAPLPSEGRSYATDAEIYAFLNTANAFEIEGAELATDRAENAQVQELAETILEDHRALRERTAELQQEGGLTVGELGDTDELVRFHRELTDQLTALQGMEFDQAWLDAQVQMHERALQGLQDALNANPGEEMRTLLTEAQGAMQEHLQQAQQLRGELGGTADTAGTMTDTGTPAARDSAAR